MLAVSALGLIQQTVSDGPALMRNLKNPSKGEDTINPLFCTNFLRSFTKAVFLNGTKIMTASNQAGTSTRQ